MEKWKQMHKQDLRIMEKKHNYLSLRERRQSSKDAKIGDIVQIKV